MSKSGCTFQIDARDRITSINGPWPTFLSQNVGEAILSSPRVERPVWEFFNGISTRKLIRLLMVQVRQGGQPVRFPFRSDTPEALCYLEMEISPGNGHNLWFKAAVTRIVERDSGLNIDNPPIRDELMIDICAWCTRVLVGQEWLSLEDAVWALGLFDQPEAPPLSHGICPNCAQQLRAEIKLPHLVKH